MDHPAAPRRPSNFEKALRWLSGVFLFWLDQLKGARAVHRVRSNRDNLGQLEVHTILDYELCIYCRKRTYRRVYEAWWASSVEFSVYDVYASIASVAPDALRKACAKTVSFPPLLHPHVGDEMQARAAVQAYIDTVIHEIKPYAQTLKSSR